MNMNNNLFISNIYLGSENFDNFGILLFKIRIRKFILYMRVEILIKEKRF